MPSGSVGVRTACRPRSVHRDRPAHAASITRQAYEPTRSGAPTSRVGRSWRRCSAFSWDAWSLAGVPCGSDTWSFGVYRTAVSPRRPTRSPRRRPREQVPGVGAGFARAAAGAECRAATGFSAGDRLLRRPRLPRRASRELRGRRIRSRGLRLLLDRLLGGRRRGNGSRRGGRPARLRRRGGRGFRPAWASWESSSSPRWPLPARAAEEARPDDLQFLPHKPTTFSAGSATAARRAARDPNSIMP